MPVPSFDQFLSPLLLTIATRPDGIPISDAAEAASRALGLSEEDRRHLLPSGTQPTYRNRIGWAHDRLKRAGLSTSPQRGVWRVTPEGRALAERFPEGLPGAEIERLLALPTDTPAGGDAVPDPAEERVAAIYRDASLRAECLELFADLIEQAHGYGPGVWEVTLQRRRVRLNVGTLLTCELSTGRLGFGAVPERLSSEFAELLRDVGEWSDEFKTHPPTRFITVPASLAVDERERVRSACAEFLEVAGRTARQTPYAYAHSPAFVDYLDRTLDRQLPRPEYRRRERSEGGEQGPPPPPERAVAFSGPRALFTKTDGDVASLLTYIDNGDLGLPDIQRPFVWSASKVRDLFDSMYRGYPIGTLLLWENAEAQGHRAVGATSGASRAPNRLIVDGQQRLTSLYAVIRGRRVVDEDFQEVPIEIAFRPRDGRFEVTDAPIRQDPEFIPNISELWCSGKSSRKQINDFLQRLGEKRALDEADEEAMSHNIDRLFDLAKYPFLALVIGRDVDEEAVAEIFVRINSEGVRLKQADFILTLLSVFWDEGRAALERFARLARVPVAPGSPPSPFNHLVQPTPDQLLRVAVAVGFHRARLKSVYQLLRGKDLASGQFIAERREAQFARLREAQSQVLDLASWHLFLGAVVAAGFRSAEMISSETALMYAYAVFLIGRLQCGVEEHTLSQLIGRWFFAVTLTGRYTNSTESVMDADLARLRDVRAPTDFVEALDRLIASALTSDFWTITLPNELETSSARSPAMFAYLSAQHRLGVPVLFSDKRISDALDPALRATRRAAERHHLFPRAWLERKGITDLKLINQVANFAHVEWPDNAKVGSQGPEQYVPTMRARFSDAAWDRMCTSHALPPGWERQAYREFLAQRRTLMANVIRRGFESLSDGVSDAEAPIDASVEERRVWGLIERLELALRRVVRERYRERWGAGFEAQLRRVLGDEGWAGIERNREKHRKQYPMTPSLDALDALDYCYLGQLAQFMLAGPAWSLFQEGFRDKRSLEDMVRAVTPVRNDRAHFRHVPERELDRCRVACEDLLAILDPPKD